MDASQLRLKLKEYESKLKALSGHYKKMEEHLVKKDQQLTSYQSNIDQLAKENRQLKSEIVTMQQIVSSSGAKTKNVKDEEVMQIKIENAKYNESMQYMFKRQKQLSNIIDDFY